MKIAAFAAIVGAATVVGDARAALIVDQEQPFVAGTVGGVAVGGFYDQRIAQAVTPGVNGRLGAVAVPVVCEASSTLEVEIQGVTAGVPDGSVLARFSVQGSELPSSYPAPPAMRLLELPTPIEQRAGTPFAIVLDSPGDCGMFRGLSGDSYPGGNGYFDSRPNPVGLWVCMCEFAGERWDFPFRTFVAADTVPPRLTMSADVLADATGPAGAQIHYSVSAADDIDPSPRIDCGPPSGSIFPIGPTTVRCTATDAAGNTSSAHFLVTVGGAEPQLLTLREKAAALEHSGVATSLEAKLERAEGDLVTRCNQLAAFVHEANAQEGKHIPAATAAPLVADGERIRAVLDC